MDALIVMEGAIIRDEMVNERAAVSGDGAQLVGAACAGDRDAFGRLVRPYLAQAVGAATLITANDADGADAVQDALLVAWQRLPPPRNPGRFPARFRSMSPPAPLRTTRPARPAAQPGAVPGLVPQHRPPSRASDDPTGASHRGTAPRSHGAARSARSGPRSPNAAPRPCPAGHQGSRVADFAQLLGTTRGRA